MSIVFPDVSFDPVMSIVGGVCMYAIPGKRFNSNVPPKGRKVVFAHDENGLKYDQEKAKRHFKKGDVLTVKEIYVYSSSSDVEFAECPGVLFNTVLFADAEGREGDQ